MRKTLFPLLLMILACQRMIPTEQQESITQSPPLAEMLGVCAGPNVDGFIKTGRLPSYVSNFRYFYLQEKDFPQMSIPADTIPKACPYPCDNYSCWNTQRSPFANNKYRLCNLAKHFKEVTVSWEAIYVKGRPRPWPDKWFMDQEWGKDYKNRVNNVFLYTSQFLETMCPNKQCIFQILEIGNEPWGDRCPGIETYHAIQEGVIKALQIYFESTDPNAWPIALSTGAFQAEQTRPGLNDGIGPMIPQRFRPFYQYISLHAYARGKNGSTNANLIDGGNLSFYRRLQSMEKWRAVNMPEAKVNLTEFGWNSSEINGVGEQKQISYLVQALLVAQRYGINRTFLYELEDQPKVQTFNSMGLFENGNHQPKKVNQALKRFLDLFGQSSFQKVIEESTTTFHYLFTDGENDFSFQGDFLTGETKVNGQTIVFFKSPKSRSK